MRAIWKGSIRFGLVTVPNTGYPAMKRQQGILKERIEVKSLRKPKRVGVFGNN